MNKTATGEHIFLLSLNRCRLFSCQGSNSHHQQTKNSRIAKGTHKPHNGMVHVNSTLAQQLDEEESFAKLRDPNFINAVVDICTYPHRPVGRVVQGDALAPPFRQKFTNNSIFIVHFFKVVDHPL